MTNKYTSLTDLFTAIADSIRAKNNSTEVIIADNFPTEIDNIRTGFDYSNSEVTIISDHAFYGCEDLNSVDCYNLTSVGTSAFENCTNLKSVILYDGVMSVGENAFKGCSEGLVIYCCFDSQPETWHENWNPNNCEVVWLGGAIETWDVSATEEDNVTAKLYNNVNDGMYTLIISGKGNMLSYQSDKMTPWYDYGSNISSVAIHNGVTSIGAFTFYNCTSLTSITIPDSVTSINNSAFNGCTILTYNSYDNAYYLGNKNNPYVICMSLKNKNLTSYDIHNDTKFIYTKLFEDCKNIKEVKIPFIGNSAYPALTYNSIKDLYKYFGYLFNYSPTTSSLASHAGYTDSSNNINYVIFKIPSTLESIIITGDISIIDVNAFSGCVGLSSITIPNSVTMIRYRAFGKCKSLTSIVYTDSIAQWNKITLSTGWDTDMPDYTIHCTDGDISKDGTITYH